MFGLVDRELPRQSSGSACSWSRISNDVYTKSTSRPTFRPPPVALAQLRKVALVRRIYYNTEPSNYSVIKTPKRQICQENFPRRSRFLRLTTTTAGQNRLPLIS